MGTRATHKSYSVTLSMFFFVVVVAFPHGFSSERETARSLFNTLCHNALDHLVRTHYLPGAKFFDKKNNKIMCNGQMVHPLSKRLEPSNKHLQLALVFLKCHFVTKQPPIIIIAPFQ